MPDARRTQVDRSRALPRELDMPAYRYQRADTGSYTLTYDEKKKENENDRREPILSTLSFSHS